MFPQIVSAQACQQTCTTTYGPPCTVSINPNTGVINEENCTATTTCTTDTSTCTPHYSCQNNSCTEDAFGFYTTLSSCQSACTPSIGYNCVSYSCQATSGNATYSTISDCQSACTPPTDGYNCVSNSCQYVSSGATYSTLSSCQSACAPPSTAGYNCINNSCQYVASGAAYSTLTSCQSACTASTAGYNCVNNSCQAVSSGASYSTLSSCQASCTSSPTSCADCQGSNYFCHQTGVAAGSCYTTDVSTFDHTQVCTACTSSTAGYTCVNNSCQAVSSGATYTTLSSCQSSCPPPSTAGYNCVNNACQSVPNGATYSTLSSCQTACGTSNAGYNCVNNSCQAVSSGATYSTLSSCRSTCTSFNPILPPATGTSSVPNGYILVAKPENGQDSQILKSPGIPLNCQGGGHIATSPDVVSYFTDSPDGRGIANFDYAIGSPN